MIFDFSVIWDSLPLYFDGLLVTLKLLSISLLIGLLLVLIAECIGRGLFYGLHMTVGLAVAG